MWQASESSQEQLADAVTQATKGGQWAAGCVWKDGQHAPMEVAQRLHMRLDMLWTVESSGVDRDGHPFGVLARPSHQRVSGSFDEVRGASFYCYLPEG